LKSANEIAPPDKGALRGGDGSPVEGGDPARERVDEAVQFGVWKCPVDVSVSFRGVAVEIVRAENDFERPTAPDQMWKTFRTAASGTRRRPVPGGSAGIHQATFQ
jgi:hypothetical protein